MGKEKSGRKPLIKKLTDFLETPKHLQEVYKAFPKEKETTIRGRLNENIDKCFKRLSKGVYIAVDGEVQSLIIEGDAWEKIKDFEDNCFDTIITDSPYTCLNEQVKTGTSRKKDKKWSFETRDMDKTLLKEFFRVLKPSGHFFSFMPSDSKDTLDYNTSMVNLTLESGFEFNKKWIWDKKWKGAGYNGRNRYEQIFFFSKRKRHKPYDLAIPDVLSHTRIHPSKKIHETEKPVELIKDILKFSTKKGEVAFDAFAGSLVLIEACEELGIHSVSIELDKEMIKKSIKARKLNATII